MRKNQLKNLKKSFQILAERRVGIIEDPLIKELKEKVKSIRENSIKNLEILLKKVGESFEDNDIEFYIAKNGKEANKIIYDIVKEENVIAKSKSNTLSEINMAKFLEKKGLEVIETDLGDRIIQLTDDRPIHPTAPALHFNIQEIADIITKKLKIKIKANPEDIMETIKADVLNKLENVKVGITGANAVAAYDGSIVMIHNEGNIGLLSLKDTHIIVFGIDKLVSTLEDAILVAKLETAYATGSRVPSYINVVSGPSKTADIQKILLKNMYGAHRVVAIALDNGRSKAPPECLWCIGCGTCITSCPIYNIVGYDFGYKGYLGGRGVAFTNFIEGEKASFDAGIYMCTLCSRCTTTCPLEIPIPDIIEKVRFKVQRAGYKLDPHENIRKNIKENGTPFRHGKT
ncbi:MAG: LUD domain-containing protein [Methanothermobacter sp.]|nr:LUD domain-containing protein [Methanothermobacter sp.]